MDYFVEQAPNDYEVQNLIRMKYGDRARILARKEIRVGGILGLFKRRAVEVTGYCTHAPQTRAPQRKNPDEERRKILAAAGESGRDGASTGEASGDAGNAVADGSRRGDAGNAHTDGSNRGDAPRGDARDGDAAPRSAPASAGDTALPGNAGVYGTAAMGASQSSDLNAVLAEIRSIRDHIGGHAAPTEPEAVARLREILEENDFSRSYIDETIEALRRECTFDELSEFDSISSRVVDRIAESLEIYPWKERRRTPHVFVLVGPTGVGKTTTIAKLAAMYGAVADPSYDVRILTIDSYRIGALQQIEKYGEIMNIPVHAVETVDDMEKQLALNREADFIFVDTIGKSPNDFAKLADVNRLVRSSGGEVHLAVSATTKRADMIDIFRHFEPFNYESVVVTKLDETSSVGGVISALEEKQKSVSFVTDGQSVPQDIERARRHTFLRRLRDLPVGREQLEPAQKE